MTTFPTKRIIPMQLPFYPSIRSGEEVETVSKKLEPGTINRFYVIPIPRNGEIIKNYRHISRSTVRLPPPVEKTKKGKLHFHTLSTLPPFVVPPCSIHWSKHGQISGGRARVHHRSKFKVSPSVTHTLCLSSFERGRGGDVTNYQTFLTMQNDSTSGGCLLQAGGLQRAEEGEQPGKQSGASTTQRSVGPSLIANES